MIHFVRLAGVRLPQRDAQPGHDPSGYKKGGPMLSNRQCRFIMLFALLTLPSIRDPCLYLLRDWGRRP